MELKTIIKQVSKPEHAARIFQTLLKTESGIDQDKEHFWVIGLSTNNTVKFIELVSLGGLNTAHIHPREVFRLAIAKGVHSLIAGHNHPSGNLEPSREDRQITQTLTEAGKIIGINLLDHLIIAGDAFFSLHRDEKGSLAEQEKDASNERNQS